MIREGCDRPHENCGGRTAAMNLVILQIQNILSGVTSGELGSCKLSVPEELK